MLYGKLLITKLENRIQSLFMKSPIFKVLIRMRFNYSTLSSKIKLFNFGMEFQEIKNTLLLSIKFIKISTERLSTEKSPKYKIEPERLVAINMRIKK